MNRLKKKAFLMALDRRAKILTMVNALFSMASR